MYARRALRVLEILVTLAMLLSLAAPALAAPPAPENEAGNAGAVGLDGKGALLPFEKPLLITKDFKPARLWYGPDPKAYNRLLKAEREALATGKSPKSLGYAFEGQDKVLYVLVEFAGTQTFDVFDPDTCEPTGETVTIEGPLHNMIPAPGPRDNNTFWVEDFSPAVYEKLLFDDASGGIGVVRRDLNNGAGVDLTGKTWRAYYNELSEGAYDPGGVVVGWIQLPTSEGEYGADSCVPGVGIDEGSDNLNGPVWRVVVDALDALNAMYPDFDWTQFDADGDGYVDNIQFIHAGMGQEAGGGAQGTFSIWSHSWAVSPPDGYLVDPVHNIRVFHYGINPENLDIGVAAEEFGHARFGLPDLYDVTYQAANSMGFWTIMSGGSWNGELGGMEPAPFPLWFRWLVGWANESNMAFFDLNSPEATVRLGQREKTPPGTLEGLMFRLPPIVETVENPMDTGTAWWGFYGNWLENTLIQEFDLTAATPPVTFSFDSWWDIEEDWDYGFFAVSTDGGATWEYIGDTTGFFTDSNPHGQNKGWGLTGSGEGRIAFDLSAYAGQSILVRLEYWTDPSVNGEGWFVDNFSLDDATGNLFSDDVEAGPDGWTVDGWVMVPYQKESVNYYLAEWVNYSGFDHGLHYAYQTVYFDDDEWEVDRINYHAPGLLVYYRDARWPTNMPGDRFAPPSIGYKQGHLVVDAHPWPWRWESDGAALGGRVQSADATFSTVDKAPVTVRRGNLATGQILETNTFGPIAAVPSFNDWYGYYPGFWYPGSGPYVYWVDWDASTVIPAQDIYNVRISHWDGSPFRELYGAWVAGYPLADGNPGNRRFNPGGRVNYGIHFDVVNVAPDGSWADVHVYRYALDYEFTSDKGHVTPPTTQTFTFTATNAGTATSPKPATVVFDLPATLDIVSFNATTGDLGWFPAARQLRWSGYVQPGQPLQITFTVNAKGASTVWATVDDGAGVQDMLGWATSAGVVLQQSGGTDPAYRWTYDTFLSLWEPTTNFGYNDVMLCRQPNIKKMLVKFDRLTDYIPAGAQIIRATLKLTAHSSTNPQGQEVSVAPVLSDWDFTKATWNLAKAGVPWTTPGGDYGDAVDSVVVNATGVYSWDVTEVVQDWVDGVYPNYGFALFSTTQKGAVEWRYVASEAHPAFGRPALEVEYALP